MGKGCDACRGVCYPTRNDMFFAQVLCTYIVMGWVELHFLGLENKFGKLRCVHSSPARLTFHLDHVLSLYAAACLAYLQCAFMLVSTRQSCRCSSTHQHHASCTRQMHPHCCTKKSIDVLRPDKHGKSKCVTVHFEKFWITDLDNFERDS